MAIALPITLFLFLLAPFFRKWVDIVVWPRLADWWAERSRTTTEKRIWKLEGVLANNERLQLLSGFEQMVLLGIATVIRFLVGIPGGGLLVYSMVRMLQQKPFDFLTYWFVSVFVGCLFVVGQRWERYFDKFRRERSPSHRDALRNDIEKLRARLLKP